MLICTKCSEKCYTKCSEKCYKVFTKKKQRLDVILHFRFLFNTQNIILETVLSIYQYIELI